MIARRKTWADVSKGSYIRSQDGVVWKVTHAKEGFWGLTTRTGETKILPAPAPEAAVDIMHLTEEETVQILTEQMGAELVAIKYDGEGVYHTPPWEGRNLAQMKSHLLLMHGISSKSVNDPGQPAGMNSKKALTEIHEAEHQSPGPRWTPHIHTDAVDRQKEVAWT